MLRIFHCELMCREIVYQFCNNILFSDLSLDLKMNQALTDHPLSDIVQCLQLNTVTKQLSQTSYGFLITWR